MNTFKLCLTEAQWCELLSCCGKEACCSLLQHLREQQPELAARLEESCKTEDSPSADAKSEVADLNVEDASEAISHMRSKVKLQHIIDTDSRSTVRDAATTRLASLNE